MKARFNGRMRENKRSCGLEGVLEFYGHFDQAANRPFARAS